MLDICFFVFIFSVVVQFFFSIFFFQRLAFYKKKRLHFSGGISVIICAQNEDENLKKNLPLFLEQDYNNYEVILVNDQSIDSTKYVLKEFEKKYNNLKVVNIDKHINSRVGKKFALTIGIKTAKFDHVLLSDADCKPVSKRWIREMSSRFSKKDIVLGVSSYKRKKSLFNILIRFDEFQVSLQYLSYALAGIPYMGVGRNLAYKKSLFFSVKGFASHIHIPSGDDDLFIKEVATKHNIAIQIDEKADIISAAKDTFSSWVYQKIRHLSTSKFYKFKHKFFLFLWPFSNFLFWVSVVFLFLFSDNIILIFCLFTFRILLFYLIYYNTMRKLRIFDLYFIYPIIEIFYLFVQLFFVLLNPFYQSNRWK